MTSANEKILFAGLPRRRRLAGLVTIAVWLGLGVAFVGDFVPTRSSADWLYGVEARRDAHARALAAAAAAKQAPARRADRDAPVVDCQPGDSSNAVKVAVAADGSKPEPCALQ